jgi:hypothetical protein
VLVAGDYKGSPNLGTGALPGASSGSRAFVAKFAKSDGHALWVQPFKANGSSDTHDATSLAIDGAGDVIVALTYTGSVIAPGQSAVTCATPGTRVVKLAGADGAVAWTWGACDSTTGSSQLPSALGVDATGDVFVAGSFAGALDLGVGAALPSAGGFDVFFAKLEHASGMPLVGEVFGDANAQRALSLVVDAAGNVVMAGPSTGAVDFGGGPVTTNGTGAFLVKLDGHGKHVWSRGFSDTTGAIDPDVGTASGYRALAASPTGDLVWITGFDGSTNLGGGSLASGSGTKDVLVTTFAP